MAAEKKQTEKPTKKLRNSTMQKIEVYLGKTYVIQAGQTVTVPKEATIPQNMGLVEE